MPGTRFLRIDRIEVQKDEFQAGKDVLDEIGFFKSTAKTAEVHLFKRFVVDGTASNGAQQGTFKIIINLRGNAVTVTKGSAPFSPIELFTQLAIHQATYGEGDAFYPVGEGDEGSIECVATDPENFAGILHQLKTRKELYF